MWRLRAVVLLALPAAWHPAAATVLTIDESGGVIVAEAGSARNIFTPPHTLQLPPLALAGALAHAADGAALAGELVAAIAWVESRYDRRARSPAGAIGVMQLMPRTARDLGVDPHDPAANLKGGAAYLRFLLERFDGDLVKAIAAYNAGPGAVDRHRGVPPYPETRRYVAAVLERLAAASLTGARP